jgi:tetratricopeptide (TPR) repeat protein
MNKPTEAAGLYKKLIEAYPDNADNYCHLAKYYEEQKQYSLAIEAYKKALKIDSSAICDIELGKLLCSIEKYSEAIDVFKNAISIEPKYVSAHFNLGQAYYLLEMYQDAITEFITTIALKNDFAEAYFRLGLSYSKVKKFTDAISAYEKGLEISPDDYSSYFKIGIIYNRINSPAEAVNAFKKAAQILPNEPKVHYNLGITYADQGDHEKAFSEYQILRPLNDSLATELLNRINNIASKQLETIHFDKAIQLSKNGLYNESLNEFSLSIEKNEGRPEAYFCRGGILLEKKEYEGALYNFNQAEKLGVNNWVLYYWRADIYSYQKEFRLVVKDLNKALSLLPVGEVETRKEIEGRIKLIQSALDIPLIGEFLADPNKKPSTLQPTYTPRTTPKFDFNFQNSQPTPTSNKMQEKKTCSFCDGSGEGIQCYSCNGTGIKTENCFTCNGTGRGYSGNKCLSCDGRGFKNSRCYFCNGKGYKPCTYCNGRGIR